MFNTVLQRHSFLFARPSAKKTLGASRRRTLIGAAGDPSSDHRCYTLELTMEQAKCRK